MNDFRKKTIVRCEDRMVFEVHPVSLEAKTCSHYDAYCFSDPDPACRYLSYGEWLRSRKV